ncbi:L,D-transpeptidase family protein [bacterium]|nr:L,D-transpeptidase family protein [bacterium]MBU1993578.1 L,D-transpeptidase family protein [bacterium]
MIKSILIVINLQILLFSSQQIVLVVSDDFSSSKAYLECYEDNKKVFDTMEVNLGKNGLGWGLGEVLLEQKKSQPIKKEGDKKAPAGVFKLVSIFGYEKMFNYNLPYIHAENNIICVDDVHSKYYNQIMPMPIKQPDSFEFMKRDDAQYELGIVVAHNKHAEKTKGSCIFMHVYKSKNEPTAGCTAMRLEDIKKIASWLDENKNPLLIQIPISSKNEILKLYPELKNSPLLQTNK